MIIETNVSGDGIPEFYRIEKERANELISHFESVAEKYMNKLRDDLRASYEDPESNGVSLDYQPIIQDCLSVTTTANEVAFASWCASGIKFNVEDYGEKIQKQLSMISMLRENIKHG